MKRLLFSIVFLISILSCRKDVVIIKDYPLIVTCTEPIQNSITNLTVGDTTGMRIVGTNLLLKIPNGGIYSLDKHHPIWCADSLDLILTSIYFDGPGPSNAVLVNISSQSSVQFLQEKDSFILYVADDTTYFGSNPTLMGIYSGYTCNPLDFNNPIYELRDQLIYLDSGESFSSNQYFNVNAEIVRDSWGYPPNYGPIVNDTQVVNLQIYNKQCSDLTWSTPKYIGIKMNIGGYEKLGWLYVERISGYALVVRQIAIQR